MYVTLKGMQVRAKKHQAMAKKRGVHSGKMIAICDRSLHFCHATLKLTKYSKTMEAVFDNNINMNFRESALKWMTTR